MEFKKTLDTLRSRSNLRKILNNITWLTFDKAFHLIIGLLVGIWFARYLGPEKYGTFNYALSIIALFNVFTTLGLNNIVIREIVKKPDSKHTYLGTAFAMMFCGGIFAYFASLVAISIIEPDNNLVNWLVAIMGFQLIMNSMKVIEVWFQSQVLSKNTVFAKSVSLLLVSIIKVYLIVVNAPLLSFAYLTAAGSLLTALFLFITYKYNGQSVRKWNIDFSVGKKLLSDSWPLIFAGLSVSVYMKIDQVMVGNMLGEYALGNYSVAVKLTDIWYFIPTVIVASVYPSIIRYKETSKEIYMKRLQQLYYLMTWSAIAIALLITFFASFIINLLFGIQYSEASNVVIYHVWSAVPVFLGVAVGSFMAAENLTRISMYMNILGAIVNVICNLLLIPIFGLIGASIATLISYCFATFFRFFIPETKQQAIMMFRSFLPWKFMQYRR